MMKKTVFTSAQTPYEAPFADIMEFAVEGGYSGSFDPDEGTEKLGRDDVDNPWG